ncbi:hypothetical protein CIG19_03830 [Enterobacterales bacterium CwR94]|nr:hypothetical protein CIG19_03830 [Enterobacterales bacterium CwR94]
MDNEIRIALSPVQLAAVMSDETITESETLSNRLWGSLEFVLGVTEMVGATALCVAPEPTGLTKAGCIVVGAHSMDTIKTAASKIITGSNVRTATLQAAEGLAKKLGADDDTAFKIGVAVDVTVPLGFAGAIGAARILSVRSGSINLLEHEATATVKGGGHTLSRHVGISEADLRTRLIRRPNLPATSTFTSLQAAEEAVSAALKNNKSLITHWAANAPAKSRLEISHFSGKNIGIGLESATGSVVKLSKIKVVIHLELYNGKPYYVLTAFPTFR